MNQPNFSFPGTGGFPAQAQRPLFGAPGQPTGAPAQPAAAPAPAARSFWVFVNGAATLVPEANARTLHPTTACMPEDQSGGWSTVGVMLPAAPAQAQPPAQQFNQPPAQQFNQPPAQQFNQPPAQQFNQPPAQQFNQPPAQQFNQPPAQQFNQPLAQQFNQPPAQQFNQPSAQQYNQPPAQQYNQPQSAYSAPGNAAAAIPEGLFSGASNASASRSGTSMEEGDYIVRYCGAEYKVGAGANVGKTWVIHDVEIVMSSFNAADPSRSKCNQIGSHCSIFVSRNQSFDSNSKEIALALMPVDPQGQPRTDASFISPQEIGQMLLNPSPLEGRYCLIEARKKPTRATQQKPNGGEFTKVSWWHCPTGPDGMPNHAAVVR